LIAGIADAAKAVEPEKTAQIADWLMRRRDQIENGQSAVSIGHTDFLALPSETR
jgi:hypothetical protein